MPTKQCFCHLVSSKVYRSQKKRFVVACRNVLGVRLRRDFLKIPFSRKVMLITKNLGLLKPNVQYIGGTLPRLHSNKDYNAYSMLKFTSPGKNQQARFGH